MLRPNFLLGALAVITRALICTIVSTDLIILGNLRESTLQTAEADLARYSLTLAENADHSNHWTWCCRASTTSSPPRV